MTTASIKSQLLLATLVTAVIGLAIIGYVGWRAFGSSSDDSRADVFLPFAAFYGAYLIYMAFAILKHCSPTWVHRYLSAIFVPIALLPSLLILGFGTDTTWSRALGAIAVFLLVGIVYKFTLGYVGKKLFKTEIIE